MEKDKKIQEYCIGCGLCHAVYGCKLCEDADGFLAPVLDEKDQLAEKWKDFCPMEYYHTSDHFLVWGNYLSTYKGYAADSKIRYKASSGGLLTALALYLLESGSVDGIIQTKAKRDNPFETETVVSCCREDVLKCMGSRYAGSAPLMDILSFVKKGKKYAFIGKPCDVLALYQYMERDETLRLQIVITMSFFCAGIPSLKINKKLVNAMGCDPQKLAELQYRGQGWPGFVTAIDQEGRKYKMDYQTAWGRYLGRDVRNICKLCMDGIGEKADIVCADLWHLDKEKKPDFSEHEGRNIVFCRTELAKRILERAKIEGMICIEPFTSEMNHFKYYQPYQFTRRTTMKYKILAMKICGRFVPAYNKELLNKASSYSSPKENWRIFKGTIKRILQGKI